jgi:hypothetical protein
LATDLSAFDEGEPDSVRYEFGVKKKMTEHEMPQESCSIRRTLKALVCRYLQI